MNIVAEHLTRQADIIPVRALGAPIKIIGAGAIGSLVALNLGKMGFGNIEVWDFDNVDIVNMNSQFYRFSDIGKPKVEALKELLQDFAKVDLQVNNEAWKGQDLGQSIVISCADSMAVRRMLWESSTSAKMFIDSRMGAEFASMYAMQPRFKEDREDYPATLFTDEEAIQAPCTAKATAYTAQLLAGQVCKTVKDFVTDNNYNRILLWDIAGNGMTNFLKEPHGAIKVPKKTQEAEVSSEHGTETQTQVVSS